LYQFTSFLTSILPSVSLKRHILISSIHLQLVFSVLSLTFKIQIKTLYTRFYALMHAACPVHTALLFYLFSSTNCEFLHQYSSEFSFAPLDAVKMYGTSYCAPFKSGRATQNCFLLHHQSTCYPKREKRRSTSMQITVKMTSFTFTFSEINRD
jgi:hypothetical protein